MAWYKVVSSTPVVVSYENGQVASLKRDQIFEADPSLPDVKRANRRARRIAYLGDDIPEQLKQHAFRVPRPLSYPNPQPKQRSSSQGATTYRGKRIAISDTVQVQRRKQ